MVTSRAISLVQAYASAERKATENRSERFLRCRLELYDLHPMKCAVSAERLTREGGWYENGRTSGGRMIMERIVTGRFGISLSERASFLIKSGIFLAVCGATLFVALAASYPAVHDTLHNVRHALAIVPCH
jgi:Probable cobalt transporter subunit (CbtB)